MEKSKLNEVLDLHRKWLRDEGGVQANLNGMDLSGTDLTYAILRRADLRGGGPDGGGPP